MKYVPQTAKIDRRLFGMLLTPSWLSGSMVVLISCLDCLAVVVLPRYQASSVRLDFLAYSAGQLSTTYQQVNSHLFSNSLFGNLPLLIFWGLVGLVVYLFAANIFTALYEAAELKAELDYVHADRHKLLWRPVQNLLLHLAVLLVWGVYILFFFHHVLPYSVATAIVGSGQLGTLQTSSYALLGIVIMAVALHIHIVLLRLLLLRPRLFSSSLYADID